MASETELERMIVRLIGDGSSYQKMMTDAAAKTTEAAKTVEQSASRIEGFKNSLTGFASSALGVLSSFGLAMSLKGAFSAFDDFERQQLKFRSILEFNQRDVGATTQEYLKFAKQMTENTTATKGQVFGLLKQAETMGFTGEKAEQMAKASIGLGTATDMSADGAMRMVIALERGDTHMLRRIQALRGIKDQTLLVQKAHDLMALGLKEEAALTETAGFKIEKLGRAFKSVTIELGGMVATAIMPAVQWLEKMVEKFQKLDPAVKQLITVAAGLTLLFVTWGPLVSALTPVLSMLLGPLRIIMSIVGALLSPTVMLAGILVGIKAIFWGIVGVLASLISPMTWLIGIFVFLISSVFVGMLSKGGDLAGMWNRVKQAGVDAWTWIKNKAMEFIDWAYPVWQAYKSFSIALWEAVRDIGIAAWEYIKEAAVAAWEWITNNANVDWDKIRGYIVDALIVAEFAIRNFRDVATLTWLFIKWKSLEFFESFKFFFSGTMPALLNWFKDNWVKVFALAFAVVGYGVITLGENIIRVWEQIPWVTMWDQFKSAAREAGAWMIKHWQEVSLAMVAPAGVFASTLYKKLTEKPAEGGGKSLADNFVDAAQKQLKEIKAEDFKLTDLKIPERQISELEKQWKTEYEKLRDKVGMNLDDFLKKKRLEFATAHPELVNAIEKKGVELGKALNNGIGKEMGKLEGVLRFSAEAISHVINYTEKLKGINAGAGGGGAAGGAGGVAGAVAPAGAPPAIANQAVAEQATTNRLLRQILDVQVAIAGKQGLNVKPAELG